MAEKGFFAKILNGELPEAPISKLLGWKYLEFDPSSQVLKVEMQARPDFVNPVGLWRIDATFHDVWKLLMNGLRVAKSSVR